MDIHKRIKLLGYPMDQVAKWRRINTLLKKCPNINNLESEILSGNEEALRDHLKEHVETRASLIEEAKKLHVKSYGHMTKGELINAIEDYKKNKITRQRFER